uniref:Zinc finger PHD-type domain-containing protein n=1 Tax=Panagrolaimus sp. PS1159 TaxID=55785 RepID=A0AC35EWY1_9BILA
MNESPMIELSSGSEDKTSPIREPKAKKRKTRGKRLSKKRFADSEEKLQLKIAELKVKIEEMNKTVASIKSFREELEQNYDRRLEVEMRLKDIELEKVKEAAKENDEKANATISEQQKRIDDLENELRQSKDMPSIASDDSNIQNIEDKPVCICGKIDKTANVIYCFGPKCPVEWYHFDCVVADPEGIFYCCDNCEKEDRALGEKGTAKQELAKPNEMKLCICKKERNGGIIKCSKNHCKVKQYHLKCVGIKQPPLKPWICSNCKEMSESYKKMRIEESESEDEIVVLD